MEREACVCDHGYERSDLCAEIIIIIIITPWYIFADLHISSVLLVPVYVAFRLHGLNEAIASVVHRNPL